MSVPSCTIHIYSWFFLCCFFNCSALFRWCVLVFAFQTTMRSGRFLCSKKRLWAAQWGNPCEATAAGHLQPTLPHCHVDGLSGFVMSTTGLQKHIELDRSFLAMQGVTVPLDVVKPLHSSELWTYSHNQFCVTGWNYATRGCLRASNCLFLTSCDKTFTSAGHFLKFQGHSRPPGSVLSDLYKL